MFERVCLVHYNEIGLKGRNRAQFERRLRDNIGAALADFPIGPVECIVSRVTVVVRDPNRTLEIGRRIALLPGVQFVSPGYRTAREPEEMERAALMALREAGPFDTFAVESRRSNTDYPEGSMDISRRVGAFLKEQTGAGVNLTAPDTRVTIAVVQGSVYISAAIIQGIGGLPAGMSGRIISLLSAGIDSPVASWRMMRRGATVCGVHFSGRPQTNDASERLVFEIGEQLALTGGLGRIYVVPLGDLQKEIALASPPDLRVLLYRRLMIRVAEKIAVGERAKALVTGESLGQVASQTLENIMAVDEAATLPVLRPLIGNDKLEIIADAKRIGTYDISTTDHTDCCTLFMPRTPETHARMNEVLDAWAALDIERMVADSIAGMTWRDFGASGYRPPKAWPTPAPAAPVAQPDPSSPTAP